MLPEAIVVPGELEIVIPELLSCTVPSEETLKPVSTLACVPVNRVGKSIAVIGSGCPVLSRGGSISKLSRCPVD